MNSLFHSKTVEEALQELSSNMAGLSNKEASIRLEK
ncbi:MAG: cation-transporting P-type ATPase [Candidatus Wukongarchaeota archaeon]